MSRFEFCTSALNGVYAIRRTVAEDHRGFFSRFFCAEEFAEIGLTAPIVQINHSFTRKMGTVRGMHFQHPPHAETKIVSCLKGSVFDVAVDLRYGSKTFLKWHGEILTSENHKSLFIPEGFAHGFQTLSADCELIYLHTSAYDLHAEGALNAIDPQIAIEWPLAIAEMSNRDRSHPLIGSDYKGICI
ncbi:dTDP-4-dehydrorhamnose 3,5-epimerase [Geobacter sulfurreducens]|uniref:dTDP-4-dehydrorhamnose 3,5-epimerase n=1 Tax=Geobacter sulfurreducens TaxID=35554 RepID=UPI000DBB8D3D|nr:dTDP-4-dehydrorhamnose 3,5-epimerase [Geobacter sulfurreducens]BBA71417.1 dTDP-4-dehydrorhamnose 3,5-epimerase [Geobacter sulfurreducens]